MERAFGAQEASHIDGRGHVHEKLGFSGQQGRDIRVATLRGQVLRSSSFIITQLWVCTALQLFANRTHAAKPSGVHEWRGSTFISGIDLRPCIKQHANAGRLAGIAVLGYSPM